MGNAQSATTVGSPPSVKAPSLWKPESNNAAFHQISPSSDLSNPSQLRHRKAETQHTPMSSRRRVSKVMSKQRRHDLPAPHSFYFAKAQPSERALRQSSETSGGQPPRPQTWMAKKQQVVKEKAQRAKEVMQGCWQETRNVRVVPDVHQPLATVSEHPSHERQSTSVPHASEVACPQFDPMIPISFKLLEDKTNSIKMSVLSDETGRRNEYLHNPKDFLERIVDQSGSSAASQSPLVVEPKVADLTKESPVVDLFDKEQTDANEEGTVQSPVHHLFEKENPDSPYDEGVVQEDNKRSSKLYLDRRSIEEHVQQQIDAQLMENQCTSTRSQRLRKQHEEDLKARKAPVILKQTQKMVVPFLGDMSAPLTKTVMPQPTVIPRASTMVERRSSNLVHGSFSQRNIRQVKSMEEPRAQKAPTIMPAASLEETNGNIRTMLQGLRLKGRRSSSLPRNSSPLQNRRSSATSRRRSSSIDSVKKESMPALLKLAGWESNKNVNKPAIQVPALLQLAGWEPRRSSVESRRVTTDKAMPVRANKMRRSSIVGSTGTVSKQPKTTIVVPMPGVPVNQQPIESHGTSQPAAKKMTAARILQQTYPMASYYNLYRLGSPPTQKEVAAQSPSESTATGTVQDTPASTASKPMLSQQAVCNAAFLFSPSYGGDNSKPVDPVAYQRTSTNTFSLSTKESRSRLSQKSQAATIPTRSLSIDEVPRESERHVRFSVPDAAQKKSLESIIHQPDTVSFPAIESKLSDLTDLTARESYQSITSNQSKNISVSPVPEESGSEYESIVFNDSDVIEGPGDSYDDETESVGTDEGSAPTSQPKQPVATWSYSAAMDGGVTPMRPGKTSDLQQITNSPYVRFTNARQKFAGKSPDKVEAAKKASPVKPKIGLVQSRIIAMEKRATTGVRVPTRKPRRQTSGHNVIAPHRSTLMSPHFRARPIAMADDARSPTMINGEVVESSSEQAPASKPTLVSTVSLEEALGLAMDESTESGEESDDDPFTDIVEASDELAAILNKRRSMESASIVSENTIPTVRQAQPVSSAEHYTGVGYKEFLDDQTHGSWSTGSHTASVSTIRQRRLSLEETVSSASADFSCTATHSTIRQNRISVAESSTLSSILQNAKPVPQFREATTVRPNEQKPRPTPGSLHLSPMQRTPMQARKWRALAAAAEEKGNSKKKSGPRRSLAERPINLIGR